MRAIPRFAILAGACLLLPTWGCGGGGGPSPEIDKNLEKIAILYGQYQATHQGRVAANEKEFKDFLAGMSEDERGRWGVTDIDKLFISPRDGEPYVILYGTGGGMPAPPSGPPSPEAEPRGDLIGHEKVGKDGKFYIVTAPSLVEEVDAATLERLKNR